MDRDHSADNLDNSMVSSTQKTHPCSMHGSGNNHAEDICIETPVSAFYSIDSGITEQVKQNKREAELKSMNISHLIERTNHQQWNIDQETQAAQSSSSPSSSSFIFRSVQVPLRRSSPKHQKHCPADGDIDSAQLSHVTTHSIDGLVSVSIADHSVSATTHTEDAEYRLQPAEDASTAFTSHLPFKPQTISTPSTVLSVSAMACAVCHGQSNLCTSASRCCIRDESVDVVNNKVPESTLQSFNQIQPDAAIGFDSTISVKMEVNTSELLVTGSSTSSSTADALADGLTGSASTNTIADSSNTSGASRFTCTICNKGFLLKSYLLDHCRNVHQITSQPLYRCHICNRTLSTQSNLTVHMQIHRTERSPEHTCHLCPMTYYHRSALHRHQRKEHGMDKRRRGRKRPYHGSDVESGDGTSVKCTGFGAFSPPKRLAIDDQRSRGSQPGSPSHRQAATELLDGESLAPIPSGSESGFSRRIYSKNKANSERLVQSASCSPTSAHAICHWTQVATRENNSYFQPNITANNHRDVNRVGESLRGASLNDQTSPGDANASGSGWDGLRSAGSIHSAYDQPPYHDYPSEGMYSLGGHDFTSRSDSLALQSTSAPCSPTSHGPKFRHGHSYQPRPSHFSYETYSGSSSPSHQYHSQQRSQPHHGSITSRTHWDQQSFPYEHLGYPAQPSHYRVDENAPPLPPQAHASYGDNRPIHLETPFYHRQQYATPQVHRNYGDIDNGVSHDRAQQYRYSQQPVLRRQHAQEQPPLQFDHEQERLRQHDHSSQPLPEHCHEPQSYPSQPEPSHVKSPSTSLHSKIQLPPLAFLHRQLSSFESQGSAQQPPYSSSQQRMQGGGSDYVSKSPIGLMDPTPPSSAIGSGHAYPRHHQHYIPYAHPPRQYTSQPASPTMMNQYSKRIEETIHPVSARSPTQVGVTNSSADIEPYTQRSRDNSEGAKVRISPTPMGCTTDAFGHDNLF
ncbi:hypothetical protein RTP6_002302 [Batrachochytrium dendrobatidis]